MKLTKEHLLKVKKCSPLLPPPGPEVVEELLGHIYALEADLRLERAAALREAATGLDAPYEEANLLRCDEELAGNIVKHAHATGVMSGLNIARCTIFDILSLNQSGQILLDEMLAKCPLCEHEWIRHDPEDGKCDAGPPCECGRSMAWMHKRIAELSRDHFNARGHVKSVVLALGQSEQVLLDEMLREARLGEVDNVLSAWEKMDAKGYTSSFTKWLVEYSARLRATLAKPDVKDSI